VLLFTKCYSFFLSLLLLHFYIKTRATLLLLSLTDKTAVRFKSQFHRYVPHRRAPSTLISRTREPFLQKKTKFFLHAHIYDYHGHKCEALYITGNDVTITSEMQQVLSFVYLLLFSFPFQSCYMYFKPMYLKFTLHFISRRNNSLIFPFKMGCGTKVHAN